MAGRSAMSRKAVCCRFGTEVSRWNSSQSPPSSCPSPQGEKGRRHNSCSIVLSPHGERDRVRDGKNDEATTANLCFCRRSARARRAFSFPACRHYPVWLALGRGRRSVRRWVEPEIFCFGAAALPANTNGLNVWLTPYPVLLPQREKGRLRNRRGLLPLPLRERAGVRGT